MPSDQPIRDNPAYQECDEPGVCPVCGHYEIIKLGTIRNTVQHVTDLLHYWGPE